MIGDLSKTDTFRRTINKSNDLCVCLDVKTFCLHYLSTKKLTFTFPIMVMQIMVYMFSLTK